MAFATVFFIALSLAMDAFAVSVTNGICIRDFSKKDSFRQGIYFGMFQFFMPIIGWILGNSVKSYIESFDHWIAFLLLAIIGGNMVFESLKKDRNNECVIKTKLSSKNLTIQAIATSIDALAVGISFAILNVNIFYASAIIGIVAFILSYLGGILGKGLGGFLQKKSEFMGGVVLILIGIKILIDHSAIG